MIEVAREKHRLEACRIVRSFKSPVKVPRTDSSVTMLKEVPSTSSRSMSSSGNRTRRARGAIRASTVESRVGRARQSGDGEGRKRPRRRAGDCARRSDDRCRRPYPVARSRGDRRDRTPWPNWACAEVETNPQKARARTVDPPAAARSESEQVLGGRTARNRARLTVFRPVFRFIRGGGL